MSIEKKDFNLYYEAKNKACSNFCRNCQEAVTEYDCDQDGYTDCCNEPTQSRTDYLQCMKFICISKFLEKVNGDLYEKRDYPFGEEIILRDNNIRFNISLKNDIDYLIFNINQKIET